MDKERKISIVLSQRINWDIAKLQEFLIRENLAVKDEFYQDQDGIQKVRKVCSIGYNELKERMERIKLFRLNASRFGCKLIKQVEETEDATITEVK